MPVLVKRLLLFLVVILVIITTIATAYVLMHRPSYDGELTLEGLNEPVEVSFDTYGIPHIYASSPEDLYLAFGYIHAQERLFQMDLLRRIGSGRLSELFGEPAIQADHFYRSLGISKASPADAQRLMDSGTNYARYAQAYINGINDFIANGYQPVEYAMLQAEPEPFTIEDIYNTIGYMSMNFAQATKEEPVAQMIFERFGESYLYELDFDAIKNPEVIRNFAPGDSIEKIAVTANLILDNMPVGPFIGSNSWVLSPQKTESGKVILANDPHIGFSQPSVWYEAHLECPGFKFYGYHLAGVPFGVIGHNPDVAWGLTMFENDDMDFFFEKINPDNPDEAWEDDHWEAMDVREEVIRVKGKSDTTVFIKETRHGPLMTDVLKMKDDSIRQFSMYWVYTKFPRRLLEVTYKMGHASNLEDMEEIASLIHAPGLNVMYGDKDGNVAWWAVGKLPIRPDHVNSKLFLDGASGNDEYLGYYDFSYNPKAINPPWGYVYSANNRTDSLKGLSVPGYYLPEDRAKRIVTLLEAQEKWDVEDVMEMMNDVTSSVAPEIKNEFTDFMESQNYDDITKQEVQVVLEGWNGTYDPESIAPTLYVKILYRVLHGIFADELGEDVINQFLSIHLGKRSYAPLIQSDTSVWYDDVNTDETETKKMVFSKAIDTAIEELKQQLGDDMTQWTWKQVHTLEHGHPIGRQKPFDKFFNVGPFPIPGGNEVINNLMFSMNGSGVYNVTAGPSKRRIVDFSNVETSYSILPTGQSGNVFSEHYMDQAALYNSGGFRKQMMNKEEIERYRKSVLILKP